MTASGTSLAGQCTNTAVVIDWSKYCHRVTDIDAAARTCTVEPGIVLDVLNNEHLKPYKLRFGPEPATHMNCTLGGMIGNNSCGATAQRTGKVVDNVAALEVLLYDGTRFWCGPTSELFPDDQDVLRLRDHTRTLAELLTEHTPGYQPPSVRRPVLTQVHCHQHAVMGWDADAKLLQQAGAQAEHLETGCCGLAGNFGFQAGHGEVSRAIAERALLPKLRAASPGAVILAAAALLATVAAGALLRRRLTRRPFAPGVWRDHHG